jgi:hypothetical protein
VTGFVYAVIHVTHVLMAKRRRALFDRDVVSAPCRDYECVKHAELIPQRTGRTRSIAVLAPPWTRQQAWSSCYTYKTGQ